MKQTDIPKSVMSRVVQYEKKRIALFWRNFLTILCMLVIVFFLSIAIIGWQLFQMQAFDMLMLFYEDSQIIAEYWQDTLLVFWEQIPPFWLWGAILCLVSLGVILFMTRKRRSVNTKKSSQLRRFYE